MEKDTINVNKVQLAHPGKRYQGQFIDGLIAFFIFFLIMYLSKSLALSGTLIDIAIILIPFSYFVFSDALPNGQSLGKIPLKICVVSKNTGKPCTLWQSFARNALTPLLGVLDAIVIFGENHQRLGDMFANTIVIEKKWLTR